jgi:cell division septal protein FtsQ
LKIFSNHRRKLEPHRRFGGREFKDKLVAAKNYKRSFSPDSKGFFSAFFTRAGISQVSFFVCLAIFAIIIYFLAVSPYFQVTQIKIAGNNQVSTQEISAAINSAGNNRLFFIKKNSFFLLNSTNVNKLEISANPLIRETKSTRSWPNKLTIQVTERIPTLVLTANSKNYLVDDSGYVIKEVADAQNLLSVKDQVSEDIKTGETIEGKIIPFIISMNQSWPSKLTQTIAVAKIPGKGATEVEFVSNEGWSVFFSTDRPVTSQLANLVILLNKQIGADRSKLAYIDLRISKWAYYCFKSTPCQQTDSSNLSQNQTSNNPTPAQAGADTINSVSK